MSTQATGHPCQFVNVQFARGSTIQAGQPRHPWNWCLLIQMGHICHISTGFETIGEAAEDFRQNGPAMVDKIEKELAPLYSRGGETPYDLNMRNQ